MRNSKRRKTNSAMVTTDQIRQRRMTQAQTLGYWKVCQWRTFQEVSVKRLTGPTEEHIAGINTLGDV